MEGPLTGVKVIELAQWAFVPSAAAVLADWGADVIKIEDPGSPDPLRGLLTAGMDDTGDYNYMVQQMNRGKRSIGLDVRTPRGYEIFCDLVRGADVLVTSFLEAARQRLRVTYDDLRAINPRLIYARGHGQGQRGPDADKPGFDGVSYWSRAGVGHMLTPPGAPFVKQRPAIGDVTSGMFLAGGIGTALYRRSVTGEGSLIDVSLFGAAMWTLSPDILASAALGEEVRALASQWEGNPLAGWYATADGRYFKLSLLDSDRYWVPFCAALDRPDLETDERFGTFRGRAANGPALVDLLRDTFVARPLAEWGERFNANGIVWAPVQTPLEVSRDPQAAANHYIMANPDDARGHLVAAPVQYNNVLPEVGRGAPEGGQHTEEVLLEMGLTWDDIIALKEERICS